MPYLYIPSVITGIGGKVKREYNVDLTMVGSYQGKDSKRCQFGYTKFMAW